MSPSRLRLLAPFLASVLVLGLSLIGAWDYFHSQAAGLSGYLQDGLTNPHARAFGLSLLLKEVLPLYLIAGITFWFLTLGASLIVNRSFITNWGFNTSFFLTLAAFAWVHLVLWWQVPSALWVVPGFQHLPFYLAFPVLGLLILGPLAWWTRRQWRSQAWAIVLVWMALWTGIAYAPRLFASRVTQPAHGRHPVQVLLLGVDGLRPEDSESLGLASWQGTHYPNAYTMVPATRLFYSLLWGGDADQYSIGHLIPSEDEVEGRLRYSLLEAYKAKGLKARFFIDDGGTIGLTHRSLEFFDETLMPAAGWENFVNSNLAVHLPFYASWLDTLRVFPSTNPWSSLDSGLRASLEEGRGADLVMFHTCHLHQPIFLSRGELQEMPRWWSLHPLDLRPIAGLPMVRPQDEKNTDPRRDPLLAYRIRVKHLLVAWKPIWEGLAKDPDYAQSTRFLFADHGERFYHATPTLRLQGIHGFDLDPWELRIPFVVAGKGFPDGLGTLGAVSMLELRDAVAKRLLNQHPITAGDFGMRAFAPIRYQTLRKDFLREDPEGVNYLSLDPKTIIQGSRLLPGGAWVMRYQATLDARKKGVSIAKAKKHHLDVFKPLQEGGAHHLIYEGFALKETLFLDESAFSKVKQEIEAEFFRPLPGIPASSEPTTKRSKAP